MTTSATAGCSSASVSPMRSRVACTETPPRSLETEARYTCSNTQSPRRSAAKSAMGTAPRSSMRSTSPGATSRTNVAPIVSRADVSRIAYRVERGGREDDERPRAAQPGERADDPLVPRRAVLGRDGLRDDLGVRRRGESDALSRELVAKVAGVDAVPVVSDGELAEVGGHHHRLRVLDP